MRGTFVFPRVDTDFMQLIEVRGNNGAQDDVETIFLLTGETYCVPTRLIAFDSPALYFRATKNKVEVKNRAIAEIVTQYYPAEEDPKLITLFHTHPSGGTTPSPSDKDWGPKRKRDFDRQFDDYEFFFGIHALQDTCDPDPSWLRQPVQTAEHEVSWWGENRKHTLALYDVDCEPRPVVVR